MVYFTDIQPTTHYLKEHAKDVPWDKVVEIIFSIKNPRKKDDKFEIEKQGCELRDRSPEFFQALRKGLDVLAVETGGCEITDKTQGVRRRLPTLHQYNSKSNRNREQKTPSN